MFEVNASSSQNIEIAANLESVRDFFSDLENFVRYMPNVSNIHEDANGVLHWKINAEVPFVGSLTKKFPVYEAENSDERIEWIPVEDEEHNLMRCSADFQPKKKSKTLVRLAKIVNLRRRSASQLHILAGLAGAKVIGTEMSKGIDEMLHVFSEKAREILEK